MSQTNWFNIINYDDFTAEDLVSKKLEFDMGSLGVREILVTKGETVGILFDGVFISTFLNNTNPSAFSNLLVFVDDNDDIWLGVVT